MDGNSTRKLHQTCLRTRNSGDESGLRSVLTGTLHRLRQMAFLLPALAVINSFGHRRGHSKPNEQSNQSIKT